MRKVLRMSLGFFLLGAGAVLSLPGVPGPGIAVIVLGLIILREHFGWARRMLDWARMKAEKLRERAGARPRPSSESH